MPGFLNHAWVVFAVIVGLLSGVLAVVREVQIMYLPAKAADKKVFWGFVRIAFVVALVVLLWNEHDKVNELSKMASLHCTKFESSYKPAIGQAGKELAWNLTFYHTGKGDADGVLTAGLIYLAPDYSPETQQKLMQQWEGLWNNSVKAAPSHHFIGAFLPVVTNLNGEDPNGVWFTARGPVVTADTLTELIKGTQFMFVFDAVRYRDDAGMWEVHQCRFMQPQPWSGGNDVVFQNCSVYQGPPVKVK
jgi:hypothetical protein